MADENANMDVLINNFVESTATAAQNLLPRIEQTLQGIGSLIEKLSPVIAEALPVLVESLLPTIITSAISLITALANAIVEALPAIKTALEEGLVIILTDVFGVSEERARGFVDGLNDAFTKIADFFHAMVESAQTDGTWLNEIWTGLKNAAKLFGDMLSALFDVVSAAFKWCVDQVQTEGSIMNSVWEGIQTVISTAVELIQGVIIAFTQVLQGDWEGAWDTVVETVTNIGSELYDAGVKILNSLWDGLKSAWKSVKEWWDGLTFSKKTASADIETNGGNSHATGLNFVPFDGYPAILHRGEAVLTSAEARVWRNGGYGATPAMAGGITINQYIQSVPQTPVELASTTEAYFEQARWML
jgi:phage-related protein